MNPSLKSFFQRIALMSVAWLMSLVSLCGQTSTDTKTNTSAAAEDRILVIVETSAAMQKRAENVQKLVGETVSSGLGGDMHSGDTVGMWTFNDTLYSGQFPLQRWTKATRQRVAVTMVQFLQQQRYEKVARPAAIWETLTNIVAHSEKITVVILSSGSEAIVGTPFDESIAQNFSKNKEAQRKAKMPFITILRAYQGKFTGFSVNMSPWPIELPEYPKEARRVPEPLAERHAPAEIKPAPVQPLVVIGHNPIYATNIPPAEPAPPATATIVAPAEATLATQHTNVIAVSDQEPKPEPPVKQVGETPPTPAAAKKAPLPVVTILVAGIALLIGIMVVFIALLRWTRRSSGESLITRTMNNRDG